MKVRTILGWIIVIAGNYKIYKYLFYNEPISRMFSIVLMIFVISYLIGKGLEK